MSRIYATINDNIVTNIISLTEEEYFEIAKQNQLIIDIEDIFPRPQIGWLLEGNSLLPNQPIVDADEADAIRQTTQRLYGEKILPELVDLMGQRNLKLIREGSSVNIASLASQMASIKLLLETGAITTARSICLALKPSYPSHADILDKASEDIANFLSTHGY